MGILLGLRTLRERSASYKGGHGSSHVKRVAWALERIAGKESISWW